MSFFSKIFRLGEPANRTEIEAQLKEEHRSRDAVARLAERDPEALERILFRGRPRRRGPEFYDMQTKVR